MTSFDNVETPFAQRVTRGPMPRWQRKQLQEALTPKKGSKTPQGDRFIPDRASMNLEACQFNLSAEPSQEEELLSSPKLDYQRSVKSALMNDSAGSKILTFKQKAPAPAEDFQSELRVIYSASKADTTAVKKPMRHIPATPDRVLDAPEFRPDFYLNLVDWSSTNVIAVALGDVS